ncbi:hypothetical protein SCHPADRAFT_1000206 [Schizopora paradoxa]|uniref:F-box domain-containing protein n=1 Tax=Schizopora paradoxa TaxID=27342 RepID=A0A0H2RXP7_9AGAM|nr:hypothetical protein SCHPADRAFT_1000206 [Schizopora paradoxa]
MTNKCAAETCFNIPEIILHISAFVWKSDAGTLSYLSRTNRCAYLSLEQERSRIVSCLLEKTHSLSLFLNRQLSKYEQISCRSLEIIGTPYSRSVSRELDAQSSLLSILNHIGKSQTLVAFGYRTYNHQEFLCTPPQIMAALRASSGTLRSLNIMSHSCSWESLLKSDFNELRNLQLALISSKSQTKCKSPFLQPAEFLISSDLPRFLQSMRHLTNLVLSIHGFKAGILNMSNLHFPTLIAIDISASTAPLGLTQFVASHSELLHLHLSFGESFVPGPFLPQDLPKLRALKFSVENNRMFATFLGRSHSESAEETCARRPNIQHISIDNLAYFQFLKDCINPFGAQLRRLDLRCWDDQPVFRGEFYKMLKSFTALVELSMTIRGRRDIGAKNVIIQSISELQNLLRSLKDCASLRAIHLRDMVSKPLDVSDLKNLQLVPPSLQFISWESRDGKTTFRIIHNTETRSAHAVACEVPPPPHDVVYDWTSKNTLRHLFSH